MTISWERAVPFFTCAVLILIPSYYFFFVGGGGVTARQDYFTHFEPSQSIVWLKTGDPREKPPDHPQAELGLPHM